MPWDPGRLQDMHLPVQAVSQQTPSAQWPVTQSESHPQASPSAMLGAASAGKQARAGPLPEPIAASPPSRPAAPSVCPPPPPQPSVSAAARTKTKPKVPASSRIDRMSAPSPEDLRRTRKIGMNERGATLRHRTDVPISGRRRNVDTGPYLTATYFAGRILEVSTTNASLAVRKIRKEPPGPQIRQTSRAGRPRRHPASRHKCGAMTRGRPLPPLTGWPRNLSRADRGRRRARC